jgi:acetolactate synthase-1/2/3 large subunit
VSEQTGGEAVVAALTALGVRHVFGIVSVHNLPIVDAIGRQTRISFVPVRHEQAAAHAADGYARATGALGVALTSTGPGAANAMGGLFEAAYASSPVLMITGQVESAYFGKGRGYLHEAEHQAEMLGSVVRAAATVRRREDIVDVLLAVVAEVRRGRAAPGAIEIPIDLQSRRYEDGPINVEVPVPAMPDAAALDQAAALLQGARAPLIWAGGGVIAADASTQLVQLAERLNAPVVTSIEGRGAIAEDHPLALGANTDMTAIDPVFAAADVVLAVGTRFQMATPVHRALTLPGALIHLDADQAVIGRSHPTRVSMVGDARLGLERLLEMVPSGSSDGGFADQARAARATADAEVSECLGPDFAQIIETITDALPRDGIVVKDATISAYVWANRALPVYEPRTSIRSTSMAIGPGLPLALGAAIGTGRPTAVIQGDGGLMLSLGELATLAQEQCPVVLCVFNDGGYGIIRHIQNLAFEGRHTAVDLVTPDFTAMSAAVGLDAVAVSGAAEFDQAFRAAVASGKPWLLDIDMGSLAPQEIRSQRPSTR